MKDFDPNDSASTWVDEFLMVVLAGAGFTTQIMEGFSLVFPFNIILLPLSIVEWILRIQISWTS